MRVQIFVSYKEEHTVVQNELVRPIQTGRVLAHKHFSGMIGDDTGDNISAQNPKYNELSAQYWVWKHYQEIGNPDYVGFMHYRRHFVFNPNFPLQGRVPWLPGMSIYRTPVIDAECIKNLQPAYILQTLSSGKDCYVIKPYDVRCCSSYTTSVRDHFINHVPGMNRAIWNVFYQVVQEKAPDYFPYLQRCCSERAWYACNMFVMKRETFFDYSQFCFDILKEIDHRIDSSSFTGQRLRFLGFLGECLLTLFVLKLQADKKAVGYLDALFIEYPDKNVAQYNFKKSLEWLFCITNTPTHKVLNLCGRQFKLCRRSKAAILRKQLEEQQKLVGILQNCILDLGEELAAIRKRSKTDL